MVFRSDDVIWTVVLIYVVVFVAEVMREQDSIMQKAMSQKVRVLAQHLNVPLHDFDTITEVGALSYYIKTSSQNNTTRSLAEISATIKYIYA